MGLQSESVSAGNGGGGGQSRAEELNLPTAWVMKLSLSLLDLVQRPQSRLDRVWDGSSRGVTCDPEGLKGEVGGVDAQRGGRE